jgi:sugar phosphate permease
LGVVLAGLFLQLSSAAEVQSSQDASALPATLRRFFGIGQSHRAVVKLPACSPWTRSLVVLFAGISALLAARLAARRGLVNTVLTHLPSNILLILVPLMPNLSLAAVLVLLVRFSISQMDVPTRQSYVMAVVSEDERSAAAGITGVARTTGAAIRPLFVGFMFARTSWINVPFFLAGTLKILYDLLLYRAFVSIPPVEDRS